MKTPAQLHQQGLALTRAVSTETLALSFQQTDEVLAQSGLDADQRAHLTTARGWILTVLEERGDLAAVGVDENYEPLARLLTPPLEDADDHPGGECFEVKVGLTGDSAEADSAEGALAAADQLCRDAFDGMPIQGRLRAARKTITITRNGSYAGVLTEIAKAGNTSLDVLAEGRN